MKTLLWSLALCTLYTLSNGKPESAIRVPSAYRNGVKWSFGTAAPSQFGVLDAAGTQNQASDVVYILPASQLQRHGQTYGHSEYASQYASTVPSTQYGAGLSSRALAPPLSSEQVTGDVSNVFRSSNSQHEQSHLLSPNVQTYSSQNTYSSADEKASAFISQLFEPAKPYETETLSQYLPPRQQYLPPQQKYLPPQQKYLPPQQKYLPPQQKYLPPQQQYLPPQITSKIQAQQVASNVLAPSGFSNLQTQQQLSGRYAPHVSSNVLAPRLTQRVKPTTVLPKTLGSALYAAPQLTKTANVLPSSHGPANVLSDPYISDLPLKFKSELFQNIQRTTVLPTPHGTAFSVKSHQPLKEFQPHVSVKSLKPEIVANNIASHDFSSNDILLQHIPSHEQPSLQEPLSDSSKGYTYPKPSNQYLP